MQNLIKQLGKNIGLVISAHLLSFLIVEISLVFLNGNTRLATKGF